MRFTRRRLLGGGGLAFSAMRQVRAAPASANCGWSRKWRSRHAPFCLAFHPGRCGRCVLRRRSNTARHTGRTLKSVVGGAAHTPSI